MRIKKGDNVIMLNGKDRGKTGKVGRVDREMGKIVVEGLNLVKRHLRPRQQGQKGQIVARERFVAASSVSLVCPSCGKPTRIGFRMSGEGTNLAKVRVCKKCKAEV